MTYDFSPLSRSFIGFDRMANLIDTAAKQSATGNYPPYNIAQLSENEYEIELALAGFSSNDLDIQTHENVLTVRANTPPIDEAANDDGPQYLHRGIAKRGFEKRFQLAEHVKVSSANLVNGLLNLRLSRELPEALKPKSISIGSNDLDGVQSVSRTKRSKSNQKLTSPKPCSKTKAA